MSEVGLLQNSRKYIWSSVCTCIACGFLAELHGRTAAIQSLSHVTPWTATYHASLSFTVSSSLLRFMSIDSVTSSNHLILCCSLFLLPSIFPSIREFPMSWLFPLGGQSIEASASASFFPVNIQGCFPIGLTDLISLQSERLSSTTVQKLQFFIVYL